MWGDDSAWRATVERRLLSLASRVSDLEARRHSEQLDRIEAALAQVLQIVRALMTDPQQLAAATANLKAHTDRLQAALDQVNKA